MNRMLLSYKNLAILLAIVLVVLIGSCGFLAHAPMSMSSACSSDIHSLITPFPDKGKLLFGLVTPLLFALLSSYFKKFSDRDVLAKFEVFKFSEKLFNFRSYAPTSAFVLVRTVQRKIY